MRDLHLIPSPLEYEKDLGFHDFGVSCSARDSHGHDFRDHRAGDEENPAHFLSTSSFITGECRGHIRLLKLANCPC